MLNVEINGISLKFDNLNSPALFSPNAPDKGTLAMLSVLHYLQKIEKQSKILDLGCGWGLVGIYAAKFIGAENVFLSDVSEEAVEVSRRNAVLNNVGGVTVVHSDAFNEIFEKDFSLILSNPPYHADFSIAKRFIEKGFNRLAVGGALVMVTKRRDWYINKLTAIFGGVEITEKDGYFVFRAQKKRINYANK